MFGIKWKNNTTEKTGSGLFIFNEKTARKICDIANRDNQRIFHWVERRRTR